MCLTEGKLGTAGPDIKYRQAMPQVVQPWFDFSMKIMKDGEAVQVGASLP